jgi:hypothetical protein
MPETTPVADDANATAQQLQQRAAVDRQQQQAAERARSNRA